MTNEMNPQEIVETLKKMADYEPKNIQHNFSTGLNEWKQPMNVLSKYALDKAAVDERRIANGELVEVVHETPRKIKPTDPKTLFEKQCSRCDSLLFATDNFCGKCGALMDGKDGGEK